MRLKKSTKSALEAERKAIRLGLEELLIGLDAKYLSPGSLDFPTTAEVNRLLSAIGKLAVARGRGRNQLLGHFRSIKYLERQYPKLGLLTFIERLAARINRCQPSPLRKVWDSIEALDTEKKIVRFEIRDEILDIKLQQKARSERPALFDRIAQLKQIFEALTQCYRTPRRTPDEWKEWRLPLNQFTTPSFGQASEQTNQMLRQERLTSPVKDQLEAFQALAAYRDLQFQEATWRSQIGRKIGPSLAWLACMHQEKYQQMILRLTFAEPAAIRSIKQAWKQRQARKRQQLHRSKERITS